MGNKRLNDLLKIGVFYDGQYFYKVSNYYCYHHPCKSRISIEGLHQFIRHAVANHLNKELPFCQITDAHYFRGRLSSHQIESDYQIRQERIFDDLLMSRNITTHYLPLKTNSKGKPQEKGIDVWLALEAYELAVLKGFDMVVLVVADGDYVPLVRKLNATGTQVMLISWDFEYVDSRNYFCETKTSHHLIEEVTFSISMHEILNDPLKKRDPVVQNLFVDKKIEAESNDPLTPSKDIYLSDQQIVSNASYLSTNEGLSDAMLVSTILTLGEGYGFIANKEHNNIFFHHTSLQNIDFNDLKPYDKVQYTTEMIYDEKTQEKKTQAQQVWVIE